MNKKTLLLHRILFYASILILAASLVFFLIKWNTLPEKIGIHFAEDGQFDVTDSKLFGFYPHLIGGIFIAITAAAGFLTNKIKIGLKLTEKGEQLFKTEFRLTIDSLNVLLSLFFANWSRCVASQVPLDLTTVQILIYIMLAVIAAGSILGIIICQKYKEKK